MSNRIVFKSNINIGQNGAENDDEFLFKCFVDHEALTELRDINNRSMFVLGSTGSGKTALLRMVEHQEENCQALEVHEMAMNYIANSDIIQFLQSIDVDLSIFFQALWRHVLVIEYIKLVTKADTKDKFRYVWTKVIDLVQKESQREKLVKFIEENQNKFWNTIDENIIEMTDALASEVKAELGGEVEKFVAKAGYSRGLSQEKRTQLQQRARRFVDGNTIAELGHVISGLADYTRTRSDKYFIIIDRLDEPWVDEKIKYSLIGSLFEALKGLQKLRNFKVLVALRNDIYEKMVREAPPSQAQIEKYNDYIIRLKWSKEQLWDLAERRINHLFKRQYSSENVSFHDIFKQKVDSRISNWNYILEKSLFRPRDIINFINENLQAAQGKSAVSKTDFLTGEQNYSALRLETLIFEWKATFPGIAFCLKLLNNKPPYFLASEYLTTRFVDNIYDNLGASPELQRDIIWKCINSSINQNAIVEPIDCVQMVFARLHLVGAIGLKTASSTAWQWMHESGKPVLPHAIDSETKIRIHPMLHMSLHNVERAKNLH